MGRFLSRDPIGVWGDAVNDGNAYSYGGNNPLSGADPTGEFWDFIVDVVSVVVSVVEFVKEPTLANAGTVLADVGAAVVPFVPSPTSLKLGGKLIDKTLGLARTGDKGRDAGKNLSNGRRATGSAGDAGGKARSGTPSGPGKPHKSGETPDGVCFTAGTLVWTKAGLTPIEALTVGQRVSTSDRTDDDHTAVTPDGWRLVTLRMPNPDGSDDVLDIECVRPLGWIEQLGAVAGAEIFFALEEMGLSGPAIVRSIEPCVTIEPGPGRVVLTTVNHLNGWVLSLRLEGLAEPLQVTKRHKLFSVDRGDWIRAGDLEPGEYLKTKHGPNKIVSIESLPGVHQVYNIEVETDHCYFVSSVGVLCHNVSGCGQKAPKTVEVSRGKHPESAKHLEESGSTGTPLTVDRGGTKGRRQEAMKGTEKKPGMDRDEAPPAVFKEGSKSVKHVPSGDNRGAGASIGNQLRGVKDGEKAVIDIVD